jgi:hypothetical protein
MVSGTCEMNEVEGLGWISRYQTRATVRVRDHFEDFVEKGSRMHVT